MENIIEKVKAIQEGDPVLQFEAMGDWVRALDFDTINYQKHLPPLNSEEAYSRNILNLEPLECVLLHWNPGEESAIHFHEGFWGYVQVLEGTAENVCYELDGKRLLQTETICCNAGGLIPEKDGVIHKIVNADAEKPLVTLHFYYPSLKDFKGMKIYDTKEKRIGTLSENAKAASWTEPRESFDHIEENAFDFVPPMKDDASATHQIYPVLPKPEPEEISEMITQYYTEQANKYDELDKLSEKRKKYTSKVNELIAEDLAQQEDLEEVLDIACGTGRRALEIQEKAGTDYDIMGVDINANMIKKAEERGIEVINDGWLDANMPEEKKFDAITYLYSFGHISHRKARVKALRKIHSHLKKGGRLYFDVFNLHDESEWGVEAQKMYEELKLDNFGYEKGDVFYKKLNAENIAFMHYFSRTEIKNLLEDVGLQVEEIVDVGYAKESGQLLEANDKGKLFVKAVKL